MKRWVLCLSGRLLRQFEALELVAPSTHAATPMNCKWIYKVKTHSDGSIKGYKMRLVAHGFQQKHGQDYDETFTLIAHINAICTLIAVVVGCK